MAYLSTLIVYAPVLFRLDCSLEAPHTAESFSRKGENVLGRFSHQCAVWRNSRVDSFIPAYAFYISRRRVLGKVGLDSTMTERP